jgi:hypothetical protein
MKINFGSGSRCLPVERVMGCPVPGSRAAAVEDSEYDLHSVAAHEAGHAVIAGHFKLFEAAFVAGRSHGHCFHNPGTPLEIAAISWGGNFAECLLQVPSLHNKRPAIFLNRKLLPQYVAQSDESMFSPPDWEGIAAYPDRHQSARLALSILSNKKYALEQFADFLAALFHKSYFEPRFQNAAAQVDAVLAECFSNGLYWHEASENFRRRCEAKGIPDSQRLPIEKMNLEMMQINPDWILMPRKFLANLLKQKPNHRK